MTNKINTIDNYCVIRFRRIMKMKKEYFFESMEQAVGFIKERIGNDLTPIRLQKTLYFLWAIYSGTYGVMGNAKEIEDDYEYPKYLFDAEFEAWQYGPVIYDVYFDFKEGNYNNLENTFVAKNKQEKDIENYLISLIDDLAKFSDFQLVQRSHDDRAWKEVYSPMKYRAKMNKEDIQKEYEEYANS